VSDQAQTNEKDGDNRTPEKTIGQIKYAREEKKPEHMKEPLKRHGDKLTRNT
jgi:hypothetical protein